jgi:hypothetical protein
MGAGVGKSKRVAAQKDIVNVESLAKVDAKRVSSDEPEKLGDGSWRMWALVDGDEFTDPGDRRFAREYVQRGQQPPVEVRVSEQPDGPYYGWIATGHEIPIMIYGHSIPFSMCFPYGVDVEEKRGKGRAVRLMIEAL